MRKRLVHRPSPAAVVAVVALFVALGGTGYAVSRIDGSQLEPRSVAGKKLKRDTVTRKEVDESKTDFLQQCHVGTVHGFVRVRAAADFPATFTDAADRFDFPYNCTGGKVYAKRVEEGVYRVHFAPDIGGLAFANAEGGAYASTVGVEDSDAPGDNKYTFEVRLNGGQPVPRPTDVAFAIMVP